MMYHISIMTFDDILKQAVQMHASDVHLKAGVSPIVRIHGLLRELIPGQKALDASDIEGLARSVMNEMQWAQFNIDHEIDLSYSVPGLARFRLNVFHQRGTVRMVIRHVPHNVPTFKDLHLPLQIGKLTALERGLILVTGVAGSGKSTTIAALLNGINHQFNKHILTVEDPIEFLIRDKKCLITQREVGIDTNSFARALRVGLRQDPDVILIGEMRDRETMEIAIQAAETGHLVFSTLHTTDASETINRILGAFEAERHQQTRLQLGSVLRAVISQRLCRRKDGTGFLPAVELMLNNARVREMIETPEKTSGIRGAIEEGQAVWGMQSFDQHLTEMYDKDLITLDEALLHCTNPEDFKVRLQGITAMDGKKWSRNGNVRRHSTWQDEVDLQLTTSMAKPKRAK